MEEALTQLVANLPAAAAVILTVWIMVAADERREIRRDANAKARAEEMRKHESDIISMIVNVVAVNQKAIIDKLDQADQKHTARYERFGITQELLTEARESLARRSGT